MVRVVIGLPKGREIFYLLMGIDEVLTELGGLEILLWLFLKTIMYHKEGHELNMFRRRTEIGDSHGE